MTESTVPLGPEAWVAAATVVVVFALLATSRWPAYLVLLGGVAALLVGGVLDAESALSGFSNPGLVTVGVLFVVAAGLRQTGTLAFFLRRALGRPKSVRSAQARLALPVVIGSAFLNNTPLVAMLLPVVQDWCRVSRISPSKLLLPLSYLAILGGLTTLIGTSTNLVVNGLLVAAGYPSLGMFGITAVGLPCALVGVAYLLLVGARLLPNRTSLIPMPETPREYTMEMVVEESGPISGGTLEASGLSHMPGLRVVEHHSANGALTEDPSGQLKLVPGDRLVMVGNVDVTLDVLHTPGLSAAGFQVQKLGCHPVDRCYAEAVISRTNPVVGRTLREARFRKRYSAAVLGVSRNGQRLRTPLVDIDLRPGDALFLEAPRSALEQHKNSADFSLFSRLEGEGPSTTAQAPIAALIVLAMVFAAAIGWLTMLQAAVTAAAAMLLTRSCSEETALRSINWPLLLAIGAAFGLARALEQTGVASALANGLLSLSQGNPWLSLALIYLTTAILTEFVTNNAAAVIVFPIAMATAAGLGVNYVPYVVAVMIGASASFVTPIGYQTNLMVFGPGGYRFQDFFRLGIPMSLLLWVVTTLLAPIVYGL